MEFDVFGKAVAKQFQNMTSTGLFRTDVEKDQLWDTYLASFPVGSNPIYKQRTEHDCQCCKGFIRTLGGVASITNDGQIATIWDINIDGPYQVVADAMATLVRRHSIKNKFLHTEKTVGTALSHQLLEDKTVKTWDHFFVNLPAGVVVAGKSIGERLGGTRSTFDVMLRGFQEISLDAVNTVRELIDQNSLYRGEEHKFVLAEFHRMKAGFHRLDAKQQELFCWTSLNVPLSISRIRNTVIGTLLVDLSEGKDMEDAVKAFETKVAPTNYKRPMALVTKAMIQKAQEKIEELGFSSALDRRYATIEDITINNILFADRQAKKKMSVFEDLAARVPENTKKLDKVEEVGIDDFLAKVLPKAESIEVLFENRHTGSLVSLIAPSDPTAKNMFKWPNNFSWSYAGELTDSIKERVKKAGGRIDADLRCSLSWFNHDDLDLHLKQPTGLDEIYYGNKISRSGGQLDVDMNAGYGTTRSPVENIFFADRKSIPGGVYTLIVNNYCQRETIDVGFDVELEFDGMIYSFHYPKAVRNKEDVIVAKFKYSQSSGLEIIESLPAAQSSRTIWGIPTQTFHKVNVVMLSPNYWDERIVGNKHYFFMLDGCLNEGKARGFFNEFLTEALTPHRKVFEMVGAKMKTDESDRQLSGLGFSSTQRNNILCRVKGAFTRVVKINF